LARKPTAPPVASSEQQTATNTAKEKADRKLSLTPSVSPESEACTIFVNGNLRSTPKAGDNVLTSLKESLPVTGKRTDDGWVQVKLPDGRIAWANPGIILSDSERQMEACLAQKRRP
jgi:flagellar basal body rod protein FlgG